MISSMTGFGRAECKCGELEISVEIRSVNHRYFEFSTRMSRAYAYLEDKIKQKVQAVAQRGKVDLSLSVFNPQGAGVEVLINSPLAKSYVGELRKTAAELGLEDDIKLSSLARFNDIFSVKRAIDDEDEIWAAVSPVVDAALEAFAKMRLVEGKRLAEDIISKVDAIAACIETVKERSPETVRLYRERLYQKLGELLAERSVDEQRVLTEAAIFAEKIAVDEETVRLESHLRQLRDIIKGGGAAGRKLDFLLQEINREINTIGSKAQDIEIGKIVVEMKSELEKVREQIQNIQ